VTVETDGRSVEEVAEDVRAQVERIEAARTQEDQR
jgi:hypothetical protein